MQLRQHARVRLRLPIRLRWAAPLGQQSEVCETRNVSRGGLLVACHQHHAEGFPLWVTFPFDPVVTEGQPEVLARVVRCKASREAGADREEIALHFEGVPRHSNPSASQRESPATRNGSDRSLALPIRVRPQYMPWFEEAMTLEVSAEKLRFVSNRVYEPGETLLVTFASGDAKPWQGSDDIPARIMSVERIPHSTSLVVTLKRVAA
jgi:hypothetical protein